VKISHCCLNPFNYRRISVFEDNDLESFGVILGGRLGKKANIYKMRQMIFSSNFALVPSIISVLLFGDGIISLILLIASLFVVWMLLTLYLLVLWTYVGTETPYEIMGKVFSFLMALNAGGPILSNHLFGILLDYFIDTPYIRNKCLCRC